MRGDLLIHILERHHQIQGPQDLLVRRVYMTFIRGATRFIVDRADDAHQAIALLGFENAHALFLTDECCRWIGFVANIAGLGLDIGLAIQLLGVVGIFDLSQFVIDADIFDIVLAGDIMDDLLDIVPGIGHHGIVGAQPDGVAQAVHIVAQIFGEFVLHILDVE